MPLRLSGHDGVTRSAATCLNHTCIIQICRVGKIFPRKFYFLFFCIRPLKAGTLCHPAMSSAASAAAHAVPPPGPNILRRNSGRCTAPRSTPGSAVLEEIQLVGLASRHPPDRVSPNNDDDDDGHSTQDSQQLQLPLAPPHESRASLTNMSSITRLSVYYYNLFLKGLSYNSFVLENANNLARDHLSNERTWLAYIRTSLLLAATGVGACCVLYFFFLVLLSNDVPVGL